MLQRFFAPIVMPSNSEKLHIHLVWCIQPKAVAAEHLAVLNSTLPEALATDKAAVLYAYGGDSPPRALTWTEFDEGQDNRHLLHEINVENRFDTWLGRNPGTDIWTLVTAWQFYINWLTSPDYPHWHSCLRKRFPSNYFIDQFLRSRTGGCFGISRFS